MTGPVRNLLIAGGLFHSAQASVPSITQILQAQGISTDVEEDIEGFCRNSKQEAEKGGEALRDQKARL